MRRVVIGILLVLMAGGLVTAQSPSVRVPGDLWTLLFLSPTDPEAESTINEAVRAGFLPTGVEIEEDGTMAILLVDRGEIEIEGWIVNEYDDFSTLEREITGAIRAGFVPMDISRFGNSISILWIETADITVDSWRIHTIPNDVTRRNDAINQFQSEGFTLWGVSEHDNRVWFLFLRSDSFTNEGVVTRFNRIDQEIQEGILQANTRAFLPNGIALSSDSIYISFIR